MQYLNMNPELMHVVRSGIKSATTRLGIKEKYHLGEFRIYNSKDRYDVIEHKKIHKIEHIKFCCITDDIAELEGYSHKEELMVKLKDIYGDIDDYADMTVIYWY